MPNTNIAADNVSITATTGTVEISGNTLLNDGATLENPLIVNHTSTLNDDVTVDGDLIIADGVNSIEKSGGVSLQINAPAAGMNISSLNNIELNSSGSSITLIAGVGNVEVNTGNLDVFTNIINSFGAVSVDDDLNVTGTISEGGSTLATLYARLAASNIFTQPNTFQSDVVANADVQVDGGVTIRELPNPPTAADLTNDHWNVFRDTVGSDLYLSADVGGVINNFELANITVTSGTFVPVVQDVGGGATYSIGTTTTARYTRFADRVDFTLDLFNISTLGIPSGLLQVTGLPVFGGITETHSCVVSRWSNGGGTAFYSIVANVVPGGNVQFVVQQNLDSDLNTTLNSETLTLGALRVSGTYFVN